MSEGKSSDGMAVLTSGNQGSYLCGWPDQKLLNAIMKNQMQLAGLDVVELPEYLRVRREAICCSSQTMELKNIYS